jgi:hypothetical protein
MEAGVCTGMKVRPTSSWRETSCTTRKPLASISTLVRRTVSGTIFLPSGPQFQLEGTTPESHVSFYFERNIVFWDNDSPLLGGCHSASVPCEIKFKLDHNVYWNAAGKPPVFGQSQPGSMAGEGPRQALTCRQSALGGCQEWQLPT